MITIRSATTEDIALIFQFIQKKAAFDRSIGAFSGQLQVSETKLRDTLFASVPLAYVLLAESSNQAIGFVLYGFRYSSFAGQPSIWLDDLYVNETMRNRGVGTALMQELARISRANNCTHLAWTADARNHQGLRFYERLGAAIIETKGHRCFWQWAPFSA
jgi:GNAT superfamily N-acetyltransferase